MLRTCERNRRAPHTTGRSLAAISAAVGYTAAEDEGAAAGAGEGAREASKRGDAEGELGDPVVTGASPDRPQGSASAAGVGGSTRPDPPCHSHLGGSPK